jgi:hypothetical protein
MQESTREPSGENRVKPRQVKDVIEPLNEPIARYGPFVMNTKEEIAQALEDLRNGTFVR